MKTKVYEQDRRSENESDKIAIELTYNMGRFNYFTYVNEKRGLYLTLTPVTIKEYGGGTISESFVGFSGVKFFLKELSRKSDKQHELLWNKILPHTRELADLFENGDFQSIMDMLNNL